MAAPMCRSAYLPEHPRLLPPTQQPEAAATAPDAAAADRSATDFGAAASAWHSSIAFFSTAGSRRETRSAAHRLWHCSRAAEWESPLPPTARRHVLPTSVKPEAQATAPKSSRVQGGTPPRTAHSPALESNSLHPGQQRAAPPGRPEQPAPPHLPQIFEQHAAPSGEDMPLHVAPPRRRWLLRKPLLLLRFLAPRCLSLRILAAGADGAGGSGRGGSSLGGRGAGVSRPFDNLESALRCSPPSAGSSVRVNCTSHSVFGRHEASAASPHESRTDAEEVTTARGERSNAAAPRPGSRGGDGSPCVTLGVGLPAG